MNDFLCRKLLHFDEILASLISNFILILVKSKSGGLMNKIPRYTLRIPAYLQEKIKYMAEYNGRSKNKEIEIAIKRYINDFERLHGNIEVSEDLDD